MEEDFSDSSGLVDLVRDLRDIDGNPDGSPVYEERQGDENIRLTNEDNDATENW